MSGLDDGLPSAHDLYGPSDSEADSDYQPELSVKSDATGGDSFFGELSLDSGDNTDVYGQSSRRDDDDRDDSLDAGAGDLVVEDGFPALENPENRSESDIRIRDGLRSAGDPTSSTGHPGTPEDLIGAQECPKNAGIDTTSPCLTNLTQRDRPEGGGSPRKRPRSRLPQPDGGETGAGIPPFVSGPAGGEDGVAESKK